MSLKIFNLTHLRCPDTMLYFKKKIQNIKKKNNILIISNDISTTWDIPLFCNFMNYVIIEKKIIKNPYQFLIKKK